MMWELRSKKPDWGGVFLEAGVPCAKALWPEGLGVWEALKEAKWLESREKGESRTDPGGQQGKPRKASTDAEGSGPCSYVEVSEGF